MSTININESTRRQLDKFKEYMQKQSIPIGLSQGIAPISRDF